jgi:hypothetical protein
MRPTSFLGGNVVTAVGIAVVSFVLFDLSSRPFPTTDSLYQNLPAQTLANYGALDLTRLREALREIGGQNLAVENKEGRLYSKTGVLGGVLSAPVFVAANRWFELPQLSPRQILSEYTQSVGKVCGAFFCALSAALLFALLAGLLPAAYAWLGCATFVLCTNVFSIASQANLQHGTSLSLITASFLLVLGPGEPRRLRTVASGVLLGIAISLRVSNACYVLFYVVAMLRAEASFRASSVLVATGASFLLGQAASLLLDLPSPYALEIALSLRGLTTWYPPLNAATVLFSPNSGLFAFSPALLPALAAPVLARRRSPQDRSARIVLYFVPTVLAFVGFASIWWVGIGGPLAGRLLIEMLPVLALWLGFVAREWGRSWSFRGAFAIAAALSLTVNILTTYFFDFTWYQTPQIRRIESLRCIEGQTRECVMVHYQRQNAVGWAASPLLLEQALLHPVFQGIWRLKRTARGVERIDVTSGRRASGVDL